MHAYRAYVDGFRRVSLWIGRGLQMATGLSVYSVALATIVLGWVIYLLPLDYLGLRMWYVVFTFLRPVGWLWRSAKEDRVWSGARPVEALVWDRCAQADAVVAGVFAIWLLPVALAFAPRSAVGTVCLLLACVLSAMGGFIAGGPSLPPEDRVLNLFSKPARSSA